MDEKFVFEFNKLCADFLGWEKAFAHELDGYRYVQTVDGYKTSFINSEGPRLINESPYVHSISELKFHSDWNWIMMVRSKIVKSGYRFYIDDGIEIGSGLPDIKEDPEGYVKIITDELFGNKLKISVEGDSIESAVKGIHEFIIWYNNKDEKNEHIL